ncbi:MAG: c-type cytochrome [Pseudomonadota bacterium]
MKLQLKSLVLMVFSISALFYSAMSFAEPADEYVVELYDTYCTACHSTEGTGAPISFDASQWEAKLAQGLEPLVNNAITGVGNMPAQGGCMECAYEDFEDLINYMTQPKAE